jgi:opacity protein-like surface antigen
MNWHKLILLASLLLLGSLFAGAPRADAQYNSYNFGYASHRNIEITPFFGGRFFGKVDLPNSTGPYDYLKIDNDYDYGVMGDVDLFGNLQAEFMWSREPTNLEGHDYLSGITSPFSSVNIDNYQWSLLEPIRDPSSKFVPYIAGGIGFTHWGTPAGLSLPFSNNVGFNLGGGAKYFFNRHYGLRLDFRWLPSRTTSELGTFCGYYGCYNANVNNYAQQVQLNGGIIFRF